MKQRIFLIFMIGLSISIFASGNKDKNTARKQLLKNHTNIEVTDQLVSLSWDSFESLQLDQVQSNFKFEKSLTNKGYLIYVFEESDYKDDDPRKLFQLVKDYKHKVYMTNSRCINIPELKPNREYLIDIAYIMSNNSNSDFIFYLNSSYINKQSFLSFKTSDNYKGKKSDQGCNALLVNKVSLKDLYNNKEKYVGKLVETDGYFGYERQNNMSPDKTHWINKCLKKADGIIIKDDYVLCITGFYRVISKIRNISPDSNYIEFVGFFNVINDAENNVVNYSMEILKAKEIDNKWF